MKTDEQFLAEHVAGEFLFDIGYGVLLRDATTMGIIRSAMRLGVSLNGVAYDFSKLDEVHRLMKELNLLARGRKMDLFAYSAIVENFYTPENFNRMISIMEVQSSLKNLIEQVKTGSYATAR